MRTLIAVITILMLATTAFAFDLRAGNSVDVSKPVSDDLAASGQNVSVVGPVTGNAMVAGTNVDVQGPVTGALAAAGSNVVVKGKKQTVFAAGSSVTITGVTARNVAAAGSGVSLDEPTKVAVDAMLAGSNVSSRATIGRNLKIAGANVTIGGNIGGNVKANGNTIKILPGTVIRGDFVYESPNEADIDTTARILGKTTREKTPTKEGMGWGGRLLWALLSLLMMFAFGALFIAIFPFWTAAAAENILARPGWSALWGLIVLIVAPVAAVIAMITVIGLPIGLAILLAYLFTWILATPIAAIALGRVIHKRGNIWLQLLLGLLVIYLLYLIPIIGGLVKLAVVLFGFGAIWMNVLGRPRLAAVEPGARA